MELELRDLINMFKRIKKSGRNEVYYDDINNNMIIFSPYDKGLDVNSVCNGINNSAYSYLINELNNHTCLTIYWSQIEGTTSDYDILYDLLPNELLDKSCKEIINSLPEIKTIKGYKYVEVKNGIERKIDETIEK